MKKTIASLIAGAALMFSCNPAPELASGATYEVKDERFEKYPGRYVIKVEISKELSEEEVRAVSEWIKNRRDKSETFIIFYHLPENTSAWARVNYSPYELEILGANLAQIDNMKSHEVIGAEIIGKWRDNSLGGVRTIIILQRNDSLFVRSVYPDGSWGDKRAKKKQDKFFIAEKGYDEWYVVEKNGNLGTYSSEGKFSESTKQQ
jgi:hypothetical protein